jgi:ribonuclease D
MTPESEELLPPYDGIKMAAVRLVKTERDLAEALAALSVMDVIGFDTESKPTFL